MELWAFYKNIAHLAGASVSYGHISSIQYVVWSKQLQNDWLHCVGHFKSLFYLIKLQI